MADAYSWLNGDAGALVVACVPQFCFLALLCAAAVVDAKTSKIPDKFALGVVALWILWAVLIFAIALSGEGDESQSAWRLQNIATAAFSNYGIFKVSLAGGFLSGICITAALLALTVAYERVSKKFAMGGGDIKILGASALFLGFRGICVSLLIACAVYLMYRGATALNTYVRQTGYNRSSAPFGPSIAIGVVAYTALCIIGPF